MPQEKKKMKLDDKESTYVYPKNFDDLSERFLRVRDKAQTLKQKLASFLGKDTNPTRLAYQVKNDHGQGKRSRDSERQQTKGSEEQQLSQGSDKSHQGSKPKHDQDNSHNKKRAKFQKHTRPSWGYGIEETKQHLARNRGSGDIKCETCMPIVNKATAKDTVLVDVITPNQVFTNTPTFIDNGATQNNYVSEVFAKRMEEQGAKVIEEEAIICSCFNECQQTNKLIEFSLKTKTKKQNTKEIF